MYIIVFQLFLDVMSDKGRGRNNDFQPHGVWVEFIEGNHSVDMYLLQMRCQLYTCLYLQ